MECVHCGNESNEVTIVRGETLCNTCIKEHYTTCDNCKGIVPKQYHYGSDCIECSTGDSGFYL